MSLRSFPVLLVGAIALAACAQQGGAARDPGSPTPVEEPAPGPAAAGPPRVDPATTGAAGPAKGRPVPVRPEQAPLVDIGQALSADSLLGRRVRVAGRCIAAGSGSRAGSWTLEAAGEEIEVRGLVPTSCGASRGEELVIFAQIEPKAVGSKDRLLLRLPD